MNFHSQIDQTKAQIVAGNEVWLYHVFLSSRAPTFTTFLHITFQVTHCNLPTYCDCGRKKEIGNLHCGVCGESLIVVDCAQEQTLSPVVLPISCSNCNKRFADDAGLKVHVDTMHGTISSSSVGEKSIPKAMSVEELKKALRVKGLSTSGRKDILVRRLEGALAGDS